MNDDESSKIAKQKVKKKRTRTPAEGKASKPRSLSKRKPKGKVDVKDEVFGDQNHLNGNDVDANGQAEVKPKTRRKRNVKNGAATKTETA